MRTRSPQFISCFLTLAIMTSGVMPACLVAQGSEAFVLLSATGDTIALERFSRTDTSLAAELLFKAAGARFTFRATLSPDATVSRLHHEYRPAAADRNAPAQQIADFTFAGDSVIVQVSGGGANQTQRLPGKSGAMPFVNPSFVLVEQLIRRALRIGGEVVPIPAFAVAGGAILPLSVQRVGTDSAVVDLGGVPARLNIAADGRILGGMVPLQGLRIMRVDFSDSAAMLMPPQDYSAPVDAPYTSEEISITTAEGFVLAGTLTLPRDAPRPLPAVVTITGSGQQNRDETIPTVPGYALFRQVADTLSRNGIAVLRMDDRGVGGSGGSTMDATTEDFANDIRAGLKFLRSRSDIDSTRLGLIGHSEGGIIAPMVAAGGKEVAAIALLAAPAWTGRRVVESQNKYVIDAAPQLSELQRDSLLRVAMLAVDSIATSHQWMSFFLRHDPLPVMRQVKTPVLIIHGETDRQVTAVQAQTLADALKSSGNNDVTLRIFPGLNHLFLYDPLGDPARYGSLSDRNIAPEVLTALVTWFRQRL